MALTRSDRTHYCARFLDCDPANALYWPEIVFAVAGGWQRWGDPWFEGEGLRVLRRWALRHRRAA